VILGFPANDFKEQEPGSDEEIASFCKLNFGVTFPLFKKQTVLDGNENAVYNWLTNPSANGWNQQKPTWNFCKYLVDENGKLIAFYPPAVSPLAAEVVSQL
jgi:glutathione peroxidase